MGRGSAAIASTWAIARAAENATAGARSSAAPAVVPARLRRRVSRRRRDHSVWRLDSLLMDHPDDSNDASFVRLPHRATVQESQPPVPPPAPAADNEAWTSPLPSLRRSPSPPSPSPSLSGCWHSSRACSCAAAEARAARRCDTHRRRRADPLHRERLRPTGRLSAWIRRLCLRRAALHRPATRRAPPRDRRRPAGLRLQRRPSATGGSPLVQARLIRSLLRELHAGRPVLVAHSAGAPVALAMALEYPDEVAAIVTLGGYFFSARDPERILGRVRSLPVIGPLLRATVIVPVGTLLAHFAINRLFYPDQADPEFARVAPALVLRRGGRPSRRATSGMSKKGCEPSHHTTRRSPCR